MAHGQRFTTEMAHAITRKGKRVSKTVQREHRGAISAKISKLRHEGEPPKKAVAMSLHMAEKGRLGPRGGYRRAGT